MQGVSYRASGVCADLPLRNVDAELTRVLGIQAFPAVELYRVGTNDAPNGISAKEMIHHIESDVPASCTHRDEFGRDVGPKRQVRTVTKRFELPLHIEVAPVVLERP